MKTMFDSITHMEAALTFHRDRHSVLAGNLANLDTPGYKPQDLERRPEAMSFADTLARTNAAHIEPSDGDGSGTLAGELKFADGDTANPSADGNQVNLEREMAKVAANRVRYSANSELVSRTLADLKYAAGDGT
jgi:flagellar basal-body rod protein FlgB